ncbi:aryl-alcohol dehydrogenase-like predicted oxidoreductase [Algoriphagus sp. 4150]|uniref:hypothetical protein n=1 Tax=Algoriphagus sp. 4150 TaxID=2817756 RepID=UPI002862EF30|nr:hypothetical protein [Algoriphagus sp. 4150]MDR7131824.1 aryl-alcohol dehydrogenase-like predicted oxidoreductase [Algoriphagus sp. 4150]
MNSKNHEYPKDSSNAVSKSRKLGNRGLEVSALGYGCMGLSFPGAPEKSESIKIIRSAYEKGITFFD